MNQNSYKFLDAAEQIGSRLCKSAYWSDSRCNWIGKSVEETSSMIVTTYNRALSPDVYDGTSGIALFLSYLYTHKKNEEYYKTAEGALNQALSKIDDLNSISRFGFYSGLLGVAYVATKIGKNLNNNLFFERSLEILKNLQNNFQATHLMDMISGNASGIPVLLEMYKLFKDTKILELTELLGDELIVTATKESYGWSWDSRANGVISSSNNLTGFSHGVAGIGYALLELYNVTREIKFLTAAENAFSYENHWFNELHCNWPDFRMDERISVSNKNKHQETYSSAWCHGAPGIGLSRIRAYDLLKDKKYLKDSNFSINTCVKILQQIINNTSNKFHDFSLCHGLSGICETLLYANQIFKDNTYRILAESIGFYGITEYLNSGLSWPCGIKGGETPGLMLGIAGIGNFYLRLFESNKTMNPLIILPC